VLDNLSYVMNLVGVIIKKIKMNSIRFCTETHTHRDTIFEQFLSKSKETAEIVMKKNKVNLKTQSLSNSFIKCNITSF